MQYALALLALAASVSAVCDYDWSSKNGAFEISPVNQSTATFTSPQRLGACTTNPIIALNNGVLIDQAGRQAEVVADNHQFQFDKPIQDKHYYLSGFSVCTDDTNKNKLTLGHSGGNDTWFACNSGSFSNLYDTNIDGKCTQIYIEILPCGSGQPTSAVPISPGSGAAATSTPSSASSSSSIVSTSLTSSTSSSSSSSSTPSTVVSTTAPPYTPSMPVVPVTTPVTSAVSTAVPVAPYPTGNATTPAPSGSGSPSSTAPGTTSSSPVSAPASGASVLSFGSSVGIGAAVLMAFAML